MQVAASQQYLFLPLLHPFCTVLHLHTVCFSFIPSCGVWDCVSGFFAWKINGNILTIHKDTLFFLISDCSQASSLIDSLID